MVLESHMHLLSPSTTLAAKTLYAAGWRSIEPMPTLAPPVGQQLSAMQIVPDWTWQAMALMELNARGPRGEVLAGLRHISPSFEPGSGWHQPGQEVPSSMVARKAMRVAAIPYTVVVLRRRGERIPAAELLRTEPPSGLLLCMDRYTAPAWYACLFTDESMDKELLPRLLHARLERENAGVRLYGGIQPAEATARGQPDYRQAWLCAPTPARAREVLLAMLANEGGV